MGKISGFFKSIFGKKKNNFPETDGDFSISDNPLYEAKEESSVNPFFDGDTAYATSDKTDMTESADAEVLESGQDAAVSDQESTVDEIADQVSQGGFHAESLRGLETELRDSKTHAHFSTGLFTGSNSSEYEAVLSALHKTIESQTGEFSSDVKKNGNMLRRAALCASGLSAACQKYISKKSGAITDKGKARIAKILEIQKLANTDKENLWSLADAIANMPKEEQQSLTWNKVLSDIRREIIEVDDLSKKKKFGAQAKTGDFASRKIDQGMFTGEMVATNTGSEAQQKSMALYEDVMLDQEAPQKGEPQSRNMTNRNVASSRVANLLGVGDIMAQSRTVTVHDQKTDTYKKGNLMEWIEGEGAGDVYREAKYSIGRDAGNDIGKRKQMASDLFTANAAKEMMNLEILDYICGQRDRHDGNYFVTQDDEGRINGVRAIDNDMSFGNIVDFEKHHRTVVHSQQDEKSFIVVDSAGNFRAPAIDKQFAENILDLKPDELRYAIEDLIEPDVVDSAVQRLRLLQVALKKAMKDTPEKFVSEWTDETKASIIEHDRMFRSREVQRQNEFFKQGDMDADIESMSSDSLLSRSVIRMMGAHGGYTRGSYISFSTQKEIAESEKTYRADQAKKKAEAEKAKAQESA